MGQGPEQAEIDPPRLTYRRKDRLTHAKEFEAVYTARARKSRGPLIIHTRPNQLAHHRLGLSVGRPVGNAVRRNRIKRQLREAFRLTKADLSRAASPGGYDIIIGVKKHDPLPMAEYQRLLQELVSECDRLWKKRIDRSSGATHD